MIQQINRALNVDEARKLVTDAGLRVGQAHAVDNIVYVSTLEPEAPFRHVPMMEVSSYHGAGYTLVADRRQGSMT